MTRTVTMMAREKKGKYVKPEYFDNKHTRLKPLKADQSQFYLSYGGRKYPVGSDPLLAMDAKARQEKAYRDIQQGIIAGEVVLVPKAKAEIGAAIAAYIEKISLPDKNGEFRPTKIINSKKSELQQFLNWSKKSLMKEIVAELMRKYRDELLRDG